MHTRSYFKNQKSNLISATRISNYVKDDLIIDYLDLLNEKKMTLNEKLEVTKKRSRDDNYDQNKIKKSKSSFDYIVESGYIFEEDIFKQISEYMIRNNEYKKLIKITESDIILNCNQTIKTIIDNKHTIILGSILINNANNTWGKPDIIVKGEWIEKYINAKFDCIDKNKWYIIDIKSSTINLINKGEDISNKLLYNVYKLQIYVYTKCLNELLKEYNYNNNVYYGFILGKKYKYSIAKNLTNINSFDYLGIINFKKGFGTNIYSGTIDDWDKVLEKSIKWNNDLRQNWDKFSVNPINKDELYPNMKNSYDKNWHKLKKQIALENKEITLLWNCGIVNRKLAWTNGIKHYDDPKLTTTILGFDGSSKKIIISSMLNILQTNTNSKFILNKLNNCMGWQTESQFEFFVDFETFNTDAIYDENSNLNWNGNGNWKGNNSFSSNQKIYMIGVSYISKNDGILNHKSFVIKFNGSNILEKKISIIKTQLENFKYTDCIFCNDELELIMKFSDFVTSFKPAQMDPNQYKKSIRLCHWSCAEPIMFNNKIFEYKLNETDYWFNWFDLLKIFKHDKYPIIIKNCFGFGLKEIVSKLNQYELIKLSWSDLDDGLLSSFKAREIYIGKKTKTSIDSDNNDQMYSIIEYNYIDCKALYCILNWMRKEVRSQ